MNVFFTLYEGDYHYGVAALLNSLISAGFEGAFIIGYRGEPPPWFGQLQATGERRASIGSVTVQLEPLTTPWHLAHVKPRFMLDIFDRLAPDAAAVAYADPDVVLEAPWSFFKSWMAHGVALVEDCNFPTLSRRHYLRSCWTEFLQSNFDAKLDDGTERYYNSGFIGATREQRGFIELWQQVLEALPKAGVPLENFKPGTRFDPFFGTDQDALNMALMMQPGSACALGPEGMGFILRGMEAMWHAADSPKPWRRSYLRQLLATGGPISMAQRAFWRHASGPVKAWSPWELSMKRFDLRLALVVSRFYHSA